MAAGCCAAFCMQVSLRAPTEVREAMAMDESVKKVAITFDDDVIIGLSQEISYKEAVSMIQSYFRYSKESRQGSAVILKSYSEQPGSVNIRDIG